MWSNETSFVSVVSMIMIKEISEISYIYIYFFEISRRYFARFSRRELATHCATKRGAERDPSSSWRKLWQIFQVGSTRARTNERPVISKHSIRALEERISPQQLFPSRKNLWGGISRIEGDRFKLVLDPIGWPIRYQTLYLRFSTLLAIWTITQITKLEPVPTFTVSPRITSLILRRTERLILHLSPKKRELVFQPLHPPSPPLHRSVPSLDSLLR